MFLQVKVKKEDQNFFCFLCWPDGDLTQEPQEYCITCISSELGLLPGCYNFALERTAEDSEKEFGQELPKRWRPTSTSTIHWNKLQQRKDAMGLVKDLTSQSSSATVKGWWCRYRLKIERTKSRAKIGHWQVTNRESAGRTLVYRVRGI